MKLICKPNVEWLFPLPEVHRAETESEWVDIAKSIIAEHTDQRVALPAIDALAKMMQKLAESATGVPPDILDGPVTTAMKAVTRACRGTAHVVKWHSIAVRDGHVRLRLEVPKPFVNTICRQDKAHFRPMGPCGDYDA